MTTFCRTVAGCAAVFSTLAGSFFFTPASHAGETVLDFSKGVAPTGLKVPPGRVTVLKGVARDLGLQPRQLQSIKADVIAPDGTMTSGKIIVDADGDGWAVEVPALKEKDATVDVQVIGTDKGGATGTPATAKVTATTAPGCPADQPICKYFGVDLGALWLPGLDEMRKSVSVHIYPGRIGASPEDDLLALKRFSIAASYDLGDFSGNTSSPVRENHLYALGIGYRMNRYFRAGMGLALYRHANDGDLRRALYLTLSVDMTAFDVIQNLVSIDPGK
jgi:hypothetical protein